MSLPQPFLVKLIRLCLLLLNIHSFNNEFFVLLLHEPDLSFNIPEDSGVDYSLGPGSVHLVMDIVDLSKRFIVLLNNLVEVILELMLLLDDRLDALCQLRGLGQIYTLRLVPAGDCRF